MRCFQFSGLKKLPKNSIGKIIAQITGPTITRNQIGIYIYILTRRQ
jgi:hypothetical protein